MSATKLVVAMALLLSATSATLAQGPQCYGDRPYYDFYGAGWLDSELHLGIDCTHRATRPCAFRRTRLAKQRQIVGTVRHPVGRMGEAILLRSVHELRHTRSITIAGAPSPYPAARAFRSHVDSRHRSHGRMPSNPADQRSPAWV
jgi:hypothetical protein